jgi:hypothetical protein
VTEGLIGHLKELVGIRQHMVHVIVGGELAGVLRDALKQAPIHGAEISLSSDRELMGASFDFRYEIFAPEFAQKVRGILDGKDDQVRIEGFEPDVEVHPEAEGVEMYSPEHHWAERAKGTVSGPVDQVVALYRACTEEPLIKLGPIELEATADPA